METQRIPLKNIIADKTFNVRKNLQGISNPDPKGESDKDTTIDKLASEIRRDGLINPLVVRIDEQGRYLLVAGFRRHAALSLLAKEDPTKYASVEVRVYSGDIEAAYFLNLTENTARNDLTPFEIGERCHFIRTESKKWNKDGKEMTISSIADRVGGHSRPYIANLIRAFDKLSPVLLKRWEQESMGTTGDRVRYMLTDRINKLIAEDDHAKQLELAVFDGLSWNEVKAGVKKEEKEAKAETEKGEEGKDGPTRLSTKVVEDTLDYVKSDDFKGKDHEATIVRQALEYVLGKRKTLFGYDPVKAEERAKAEKEAEKAAKKAEKEAEKAAKKAAKPEKNGQAEASA